MRSKHSIRLGVDVELPELFRKHSVLCIVSHPFALGLTNTTSFANPTPANNLVDIQQRTVQQREVCTHHGGTVCLALLVFGAIGRIRLKEKIPWGSCGFVRAVLHCSV